MEPLRHCSSSAALCRTRRSSGRRLNWPASSSARAASVSSGVRSGSTGFDKPSQRVWMGSWRGGASTTVTPPPRHSGRILTVNQECMLRRCPHFCRFPSRAIPTCPGTSKIPLDAGHCISGRGRRGGRSPRRAAASAGLGVHRRRRAAMLSGCSGRPRRGRSSMAEQQLPKLLVRVRFPSPAPCAQVDSSRRHLRAKKRSPRRWACLSDTAAAGRRTPGPDRPDAARTAHARPTGPRTAAAAASTGPAHPGRSPRWTPSPAG